VKGGEERWERRRRAKESGAEESEAERKRKRISDPNVPLHDCLQCCSILFGRCYSNPAQNAFNKQTFGVIHKIIY